VGNLATEETTWGLLARRERELVQRVAARDAENAKDKHELGELRRAMEVLDPTRMAVIREIINNDDPAEPTQYDFLKGSPSLTPAAAPLTLIGEAPQVQEANASETPPSATVGNIVVRLATVGARFQRSIAEAADNHPFLEFEHLTIKQLIIKSLTDHFRDGATAAELIEFIGNAYGRQIERSSFSPQLSRLREEGMVRLLLSGKWKRVPKTAAEL
jgi:hypothetical protein